MDGQICEEARVTTMPATLEARTKSGTGLTPCRFVICLKHWASVFRGFGGRRENAVEAKVHGLSGVMVSPGARQDEHDAGA